MIVNSDQIILGYGFPHIVQSKCLYFLQPQRAHLSVYLLFGSCVFLSRVCKRKPGTFLSFFCHTSSPLAALEMDTPTLYHKNGGITPLTLL